ncbi:MULTISPECIES: hypothetical protein [Streptomyces]|uniref:hypothetical protein n=1 Tax=Streptomyces TaxID=1883 RepID=UPI001370D8A7|nr:MULTISPECIES: hypothetical protein [Streptomyces]NDZ99249.1 hypothetical protein [Streptomyces sp. SID10116]MYY81717.1 hypothetical protein [Streptomyces sp. SID335]MYZ13039.1 hypothetical protein [Streptomyces sp. SID337]NEA06417.1 hypothetical protein [Streptomyces sp. SID10116]NEB46731.1 hypothetical protein [Streptomyces sp. SID339]
MLTERAADGWATRRTVAGGPDSCVNATAKVKVRSPTRGRDMSPSYVTETLCDGHGGGAGGGGSGRVTWKAIAAAPMSAAVVAARVVRRNRGGRGRVLRGGVVSWS